MAGAGVGCAQVDEGQVEVAMPGAEVGTVDGIDVAVGPPADDATVAGRQRGADFETEGRLLVHTEAPLQHDAGHTVAAERLSELVGLTNPRLTADADAPVVAEGQLRGPGHAVASCFVSELTPHPAFDLQPARRAELSRRGDAG